MRSAVVSFFRRRRRFLFAWQTIPSGTTTGIALNTSGRRCISAPLWTSKHGFEKRSFEKPLSAPYSFLNKAHFLVLIPAVLKTIARFKSRALALLTLFPSGASNIFSWPSTSSRFSSLLALPLRDFSGILTVHQFQKFPHVFRPAFKSKRRI